MTPEEQYLYEELSNSDSLELAPGGSKSTNVGAELSNIRGNPKFKAQFNLQVQTRFRQLTWDGTGENVQTDIIILPAALPPGQQTQLPVFTFGNADFQGGYDKAKNLLPLSGWFFQEIGVVGKDRFQIDGFSNFITTGVAVNGDMLFVLADTLNPVAAPTAQYIFAEVLIHCPQLAYGTLLDSSGSDSFIINMIRYKVAANLTAQFDNQIRLLKQTLFGRAGDDKVDPGTYITGETFNQNISDIPLAYSVDKNKGIHSYLDYDVQAFNWIITVATTKRTMI